MAESEIAEEKSEAKSDPLHEIRERYKKASEYWADDRKAALDDLKFRSGKQWPEDILTKRQNEKRPCLTVDKLSQYVRQIVNDGRQNRPAIKTRPVDSGADVPTSEIYQGLIKHIEDRSNADAAYDTSLDGSASCGQGYFKVDSEYAGEDSPDQELRIRRVRNHLSILIDPASQEADGSDMKYAFEIFEMDEEDYKATYPGKSTEAFADDATGWFGDQVRVCRHWYIEETPRKLYILTNGSVVPEEEFDAMKAADPSVESMVKDVRDVPKRKVMHCKVNGKEYLEEPEEWPGKYIPILVVWGNELDVEGKVIHSGIIRPAKDPQRLYNYSRSAFAERVALTPKAPWVAAEGQVEEYEDEWKTANTENHSVLRYRPTSLNGQPVPPPQRTSASDIPAGFAEDMRISEHDIQGAIGMYAASLGAPSNERSGKAIMARQKEGDVGTFHYHDNLNRAIRHCGRILVDLIPKIYDSNRVVRILGYDGTPDQVELNPNQPTASQKVGMKMMYNLGVGTYDVTISSGPSYNTLRQEAVDGMSRVVETNPEMTAIIGDLIFKNLDWPGAQEISERLKLMLPPPILEAEKAKKQQSMSPEMQQAITQFDQAIQQKDAMIQQAADRIEQLMGEMASLKEAHDIKEKEVSVKADDTAIKAYDAETKRMVAMQPAMTAEELRKVVLQTLVDLGTPSPTPEAEMGEGMDMGGMPPPEQPPMGMPAQ